MQAFGPHPSHQTAILVSRPGVMQQALRASLSAYAGIQVVASCGDGLSALAQLATHRPQLLIIDSNLLDEEVAALVSTVKARQPETYCLVLQQTGHRRSIALGAGADAAPPRERWLQELPGMAPTGSAPSHVDETSLRPLQPDTLQPDPPQPGE